MIQPALAGAPAEPRFRLLLVDDNPANLLAVRDLLAPLGHEIVTVGSGRAALRALLADDCALILLDVQMPGMDGLETAALIRSRERSRSVPIVFLTGGSPSDDVMFRGYEVGAVDYLYKPIVPEVLLAKVRAFMEMARSRWELERQTVELGVLNADLVRARERAERASQVKSAFLANMSHELRTPLNAIMGFTQLLDAGNAGPVSDEQRELLGEVLVGSRYLVQLIDDVLDLAKVESGTFLLRPEPTDVREIAREVCEAMRPLAAAKGIRMAVRVASLPQLMLDVERLRQVLYNYVSNAVKFTSSGGRIEIRAAPVGADRVRIEVRDTGIGISAEDIPQLFNEFVQLDATATRRHKGTGLGLALTKRLLEIQGGSVGVTSRPGKGSVFYAVLPRVEVVAGPPFSVPAGDGRSERGVAARRARRRVDSSGG